MDSVSGDTLSDIIRTVSVSDGFFKHQQKDDPDLTVEEKSKIASDLISRKPDVFVSRYGKYLSEDQLKYFEHLPSSSTYELEFYLREARQSQCKIMTKKKIRNRRYEALKRMIEKNDDYFSETAMKARNPLLHEQLIGRFMTEKEKEEESRPDMTNCSLTQIILNHMDINKERDDKKRMKDEEDEEEFDTDDEEEAGDDNEEEGLGHVDGGRDFLRNQFVKSVYQSFLDGKDEAFDYSKIDHDNSLDDLDVEGRDAEERYFDDSDVDE